GAAALETGVLQPLGDALRTRLSRCRPNDRCTLAGKLMGDRPADAAGGTGDDGYVLRQHGVRLAHASLLHACSARCNDSVSSIANISISLFFSMRRFSPVSTRPGPHSTMMRAPSAIIA